MKRQDEVSPGYRTQSRDTDVWAERMLFEHWRGMAPWEKAALASELTKSLHRLSLAGLEARFPNDDPAEIALRAARLRLGPELMEQVTRRMSDS